MLLICKETAKTKKKPAQPAPPQPPPPPHRERAVAHVKRGEQKKKKTDGVRYDN